MYGWRLNTSGVFTGNKNRRTTISDHLEETANAEEDETSKAASAITN